MSDTKICTFCGEDIKKNPIEDMYGQEYHPECTFECEECGHIKGLDEGTVDDDMPRM